jgi:hypothetical protein
MPNDSPNESNQWANLPLELVQVAGAADNLLAEALALAIHLDSPARLIVLWRLARLLSALAHLMEEQSRLHFSRKGSAKSATVPPKQS